MPHNQFTDMTLSFPIEVSDDLTITIKKAVDNSFEYYPGVLAGSSQWWGDMTFAASDEIILTRDTNQGAVMPTTKTVDHIMVPQHVVLTLDNISMADKRRMAVEQRYK